MAGFTRMVDMALTDDEKLDMALPMSMPDRPDYPPGLRICLTQPDLDKLGVEDDCQIGDMIDIRCFATVTSISKTDGPMGPSCRIELQIEHMSCENEMDEVDADD